MDDLNELKYSYSVNYRLSGLQEYNEEKDMIESDDFFISMDFYMPTNKEYIDSFVINEYKD